MRARTVARLGTRVLMWVRTRCEHRRHPILVPAPVLKRPMRVLRVFMRASEVPHADTRIPMKVLEYPHGTRSTHVKTLSAPSLLALSVPLVSPPQCEY
jgi:hypothetical protein